MDFNLTILSAMSAIVVVCITIIGWFMMVSLKESRENTLHIGILRGTIESNRVKSNDDVNGLSKQTDLKLQHLTLDVNTLAKSVNRLFDVVLENKFNKDE